MKQNCTPENGYNGQFYVCPCVPNHFSHVQLFATHGPWPSRFLCPWDFPGKNTGVGWDALLQGVFLTQGLNPHLLCLLHCGFFTNEPLGKSNFMYTLAQFLKTGKKKTSRRGAFSAIFFRYCERTGWLGQQYLLGDLGNLEAVSRDLWGWVKDMWGAGGAPGVRSAGSAWPHLPLLLQRYQKVQLDFSSYPGSPWQLPGAFPPSDHCRKTFLEGLCFLPQTNFLKF